MPTEASMVPFVGPTYELLGNSFAHRRAINMYLQSGEGQAKYSEMLLGTPGSKGFIDLEAVGIDAAAGCRGMWLTATGTTSSGNLYWVYGSKLGYTYLADSGDYISKVIYDIGAATSRVSMADNGKYLTLVNGFIMLNVDIITDAVTDITSQLPFDKPYQVAWYMGRMVCITRDNTPVQLKNLKMVLASNLIWYSDIGLDGVKNWDALSFVGADASTDEIWALTVRQGDLWAFGPRSYQIFSVTTNPDDPIKYSGGSATNIGINAPWTAQTLGESCFFVGSNAAGKNQVYMSQGFNVARISNHGIEHILETYGRLTESAYATSYSQEGHSFYIITIPPGNYEFEGRQVYMPGRTLAYDVITQQWHERASRDPKTGELSAWQPVYTVWAFGKILAGNMLWPNIMELRLDTYTDYDPTTATKTKPIYREYQSGVMFNNLQLFALDEFQWDMVVGHVPASGLSAQPIANIQISWDGGNTFGSKYPANLPKSGVYAGRARWLRLGTGRNAVVRISIAEDAQFMAGSARVRSRVGAC